MGGDFKISQGTVVRLAGSVVPASATWWPFGSSMDSTGQILLSRRGVLLLDVPLLFIILLFCHPGTQISCFAPTNFSWKQAAYVDSFCWAAVQQQPQSAPLWLHKVDTSPTFVHTEAFSTSGNIIIIINIISYIITIACAESPLHHFVVLFLLSVLSIHSAPSGHPRLHPSPFLAIYRNATSLLWPQLHHGGAGSILHPGNQNGQELSVHRRQREPEGNTEVTRVIVCFYFTSFSGGDGAFLTVRGRKNPATV